MSSRWKKVWADFWGNKTRTVLTILTILVGTAGVGFISNLNLYMSESMDSDFLSTNPSEAKIYAYPMDDETVKIAGRVTGVGMVEGKSLFNGLVIQPDGQRITIQFTGMESPSTLKVDALKPVKGETSIPSLDDHEVLIDSSAAVLGYKPGDLITVEVDNRKQRQLRLAGYMHAAAGIPFSQVKIVTAYVTPKTMEWLGGQSDYNMLAVSVANNPTDQKHVTQVSQAVKKRLEESGLTVYSISIYEPGHHYAYRISQGMFLILGILGWLVVLLSVFLIVNTINALMSQQTRQIGIMKSTGGTTLQILGMYMVLILSFGVVALLIAIPLANREAERIGIGMADYLGFYVSPYRGYTATLIQQIMVALVIPLLAALWPVYNSVRITVREALTDYGIRGSSKAPRRAVNRFNLLIPRPMRLSLRNAFRRKARLSLTLFTLVLAGAIFISVFNLWASFNKVIEELQGYYIADIIVYFDQAYRLDRVTSLAESVPGVETVEGWLEYTGTVIRDGDESGQVGIVAPPSGSSLIKPIVSSGRAIGKKDENAIAVSNGFMQRYPDAKVGDWVTIKLNGRETDWQIVGVYTITTTGGNPLLYTNAEYLSRMIGEPGHTYSLHVITDRHDIPSQKLINGQLRAAFAAHSIQVSYSQLGAEETQRITSLFNIFIYFFLVMSTLIAIIGGLGLMSMMSINVMERTREIGVMRAIGASNWNIQSIVIVEGLVIGLISWIISILLAVPLTSVMATGVGLQLFSNPLQIVYGWNGIFLWLVGILGIGILASALPARGASRLTVKDTLAYE